MADNTLKGTLNASKNIGSNLNPTNIGNFQKVMRDISRQTYEKQAKKDVKSSALGGVKASDVSGGTFASIMSSLEQMRGGDISKEFAAGVQGYKDTLDAQEEKRKEAASASNTALANQTKTLELIKGYQDAGLDVPPALYAAIGTKDPSSVSLSPEDAVVTQTLATSVGEDGYADPNKYQTAKEAYIQTHQSDPMASQTFDNKFGSSLSEPERTNLGITIVPKVSVNTNTPEYKAASAIMRGEGRLSDVSTAGNLRSRTGAILGQLKDEAVKGGDIYGIIRSSAGGAQVDATSLQSFEKATNVLYQLGDLGKTIENESTGPIMGIIRSNNPYDTKAQEIKAALQSIVPNLARGVYGEVGVLTDNDIANYSKTIPNLKSTEDVRNAILAATVKSIQRSLENKIKTQAGFGRDVSGIEQMYKEIEAKTSEINNAFDKSIAPAETTDTKEWLKGLSNPVIDDYLSSKGF